MGQSVGEKTSVDTPSANTTSANSQQLYTRTAETRSAILSHITLFSVIYLYYVVLKFKFNQLFKQSKYRYITCC